jgi:hypothetical protein
MNVRTKKAAMAAGMKTAEQWMRSWCVPKRGAQPTIIKDTDFYSPEQLEPVMTKKSAAKNRGLSTAGAMPCGVRDVNINSKWIRCSVYRLSDLRPLRPKPKPKQIDLMHALYAVNSASKRFRDASHRQENIGLANHSFQVKEELYKFKNKGIAEAYRQGRLEFMGCSRGFAVYIGEGYRFHATFAPKNASVEYASPIEPLFVEAKPKTTDNPRLVDSRFTLAELPSNFDDFIFLPEPSLDEQYSWGSDEDYHEFHVY